MSTLKNDNRQASAEIETKDNIPLGVLYGLSAFALLAAMSAFAKLLYNNDHHVIAIAFYRNALFAVPLIAYILIKKRPDLIKTKKPKLMALRVFIGSTGLIITFKAISMLPLSDATMLFFTSVLFTPALAYFFLKEKIGIHRWGAIFIGLLGVAIIVGPSGQIPLLGGLVAIIAAVTHAGAQTVLRGLKTESSFTVTLYFTIGASFFCALFMPFVGKIPSGIDYAYILGIALSGGFAQLCLSSSLRLAPATLISPLTFTGLLWTTLFDIFIWHDTPGWPIYLGAALIMTAQLYILYREKLKSRT
ncbi:MAG: hypothetical protein CBB87_05905 [Micavibrio sp. TMED27]|nr:hypothetical protein [Micavibrio sp.]OUT91550.1 MAG: hypothetical protein CBB87_05905 [Micavibrio sp. TMED27]|tara:strand:- start:2084 stop:2995 length:912 start_codon:yes stop_codon:yes gene_type:complete